jgi:RNA polymerase sigma factor (sigma-70 family)
MKEKSELDALESNDIDLLEKVAGGDRRAFEQLYHRYHRRLFGYLLRWLKRPEVVEEVLDDVMFVVFTDAERFEGRSRVSTWILGIAFRKAMRALRQDFSPDEIALEDLPESATRAVPPHEPSDLRRILNLALARLSPDHRAVVELTYFQECSYDEIAQIVACPVNTVKTRMFHARRHLRRILPHLGWTST